MSITWNEGVSEETKAKVLRRRFPKTNPFRKRSICIFKGIDSEFGPIYEVKASNKEIPKPDKHLNSTTVRWFCGCETFYEQKIYCRTCDSYHNTEALVKSCGEAHSRAYDPYWEDENESDYGS